MNYTENFQIVINKYIKQGLAIMKKKESTIIKCLMGLFVVKCIVNISGLAYVSFGLDVIMAFIATVVLLEWLLSIVKSKRCLICLLLLITIGLTISIIYNVPSNKTLDNYGESYNRNI